jgi:hypothetical protein
MIEHLCPPFTSMGQAPCWRRLLGHYPQVVHIWSLNSGTFPLHGVVAGYQATSRRRFLHPSCLLEVPKCTAPPSSSEMLQDARQNTDGPRCPGF